jgi:hypothetical protein
MAHVLQCGHCGTGNVVAACTTCDRHFVVTADHAAGRSRTFGSAAISKLPENMPPCCDFCTDTSPLQRVAAGLRQRTCANCHVEFLSGHDL